jgi:DNA repair exonuclease SbcCD ATPase subunit
MPTEISRQRITHIIHIADLHVRIGTARVDEYRHVFNGFIENIRHLPCVKEETALLVIAGDVFHTKCRMESAGTIVLFEWINVLLDLLPIVVICGNHDFKQEDPTIPDSIKMFITPYAGSVRKHEIHYLSETGHYTWGNLGIGLVHIKDTLRAFNTSGIVDELPPFPSPKQFPESTECKIALFHGTIASSSLTGGRTAETVAKGYPLGWFAGYDFVILGDNHKQQTHVVHTEDVRMHWGYPGSLIQQDYGEPTFGHGYLLWDIEAREVSAHHIRNDYGAFTLYADKLLTSIVPGEVCNITSAMTNNYFPAHPKIRVIGNKKDETEILRYLSEYNIKASDVVFRPKGPKLQERKDGVNNDDEAIETIGDLSHMNGADTWESFIRQIDNSGSMIKWIRDVNEMKVPYCDALPEIIKQSITDRTKTINKLIAIYNDTQQTRGATKYRITLKYMSWDYLMCYGQNNYFDFEKIQDHIGLLNGPNASGKSAFLDVLSIAIFGKPTSSRQEFSGNNMSSKIINDFRSANTSAGVYLVFEINGKTYEIHRTFSMYSDAKRATLIKSLLVNVYEYIDDGKIIIADGNVVSGQWIDERFGTAEEFLMSTVLCQSDTTNFFYKSKIDQRKLLEKAFNMDSITTFTEILKESVNAHKHFIGMTQTYIAGHEDEYTSKSKSASAPTAAAVVLTDIDKLQTTKTKLEDKIQLLENQIFQETNNLGDITTIKEIECADVNAAKNILTELSDSDDNNDTLHQEYGIVRDKYETLRSHNITDDDKLTGRTIENIKVAIAAMMIEKPEIDIHMTDDYIAAKYIEYEQWYNNNRNMAQNKKKHVNKELEQASQKLTYLRNSYSIPMPPDTIIGTGTDVLQLGDVALEDVYAEYMGVQATIKEHESLRPECVRHDDTNNYSELDSYPKEWRNGVSTVIQELKYEIDMIAKIIEQHQDAFVSIPTLDRPKVINKELVSSCQHSLSELQKPIHPIRSMTEYGSWKKKWSAWRKFVKTVPVENVDVLEKRRIYIYEKYTELSRLETELQEMRAELEEISKIEFNPNCHACCRQPKYIKLQTLQTVIDASDKRVTKLRIQINKQCPSGYDTELETLDSLICARKEYDSKYEFMNEEHDAWANAVKQNDANDERLATLAHVWWFQREAWETKNKSLRKQEEAYKMELQEISDFQKVWSEYKDSLNIKEKEQVYNKWDTEYKKLTSHRNALWQAAWIQYDANIKKLETTIAECTQQLEAFRVYSDAAAFWKSQCENMEKARKYNEWKSQVDSLTRSLNVLEWRDVRDKYDSLKTKLHNMDRRKNAALIIREYERHRAYISYKSHKQELDLLRRDLGAVDLEIKQAEKHTTKQTMHDIICSYLKLLYERQESLENFQTAFVGNKSNADNKTPALEGFKSWVYRTSVIPILEKEVNEFLQQVDEFRLKIKIHNDNFIYMLEDRGSNPTLDNASGYQKFVVGLAMRVTLAKIGSTGQNIRHIFIDEGFVAFDATNIHKTRDIIELLKDIFKNVLLISHLESIREATDLRIDIGRSGQTSYIRYGKPRKPVAKTRT